MRRVPANTSVRFEDVKAKLERELQERYRDQGMVKLLEELKAQARARLLWKPPAEREGGEK